MWNLRSWKEVGGSRSRRAGGKLLRRMWDPRTALLPLLLQLLLQLFLQLLLQFGTSQLFLTLRSFPVSSLIFYIFGERIDLSSSSIPALSYSSSCLCSSVWTLSTFQLPIGILCYIVIFLNPLSPNTHQKGNGWIRSVPNMEKLLWRRSEKLMPPVSYLPFWQTDCFQWWSRLKSVVLHSPALLSSTEDPKFPNMADLTNWKRALLLDSINITTAAL